MAINDLFGKELKVINVGLRSFAVELRKLDRKVVQVDWQPVAGGDPRLQAILERMRKRT